MKIVCDLETTVQFLDNGVKDNSPFNEKNKIVSFHWKKFNDENETAVKSCFVNHVEVPVPEDTAQVLQDLAKAELFVAHNAKFDAMYLLEAGITIPKKIWCTMLGEYVLARGQAMSFSLKESAIRREVSLKKSDLVDDLFKSGVGFDQMARDTVQEYAEADVQSCYELYLKQKEEFKANPGLFRVFELMNEMLLFLVEIERNGIKIDLTELDKVEHQFVSEKSEIEKRLQEIVVEVMGDTPINLNSGSDLSSVIYSRYVTNKPLHKKVFQIGKNARGKPLPPPRMTPSKFTQSIRNTTKVMKKTHAEHCNSCNGKGKYLKFKKNGEPYKNMSTCKVCEGRGFLLIDTGKTAGLRMVPESPADASVNGFKTDKITIKRLIAQAETKENPLAIEFLSKIMRLNALNTYLDSFVKGIQAWTRRDGRLHANFNQATTRTGRLSSSNPNFQNQPKGGKFPVRRCVVSRFPDGKVLEADFSGLEFRVAGLLSQDAQIIDDLHSGKDVHKQTASIINQCDVADVTKDMRQAAKAYTFAPLYGGMGANEPPHVQKYFQEYFNIYKGLKIWHEELADQVLREGIIRTPSGREFAFPNTRRLSSGRVTNNTAIVNYPVQSFATADIVPLACVRAFRKFKEHRLSSKLVLTVHDSIVVDVHPNELEIVKDILTEAMEGVTDELAERFDFKGDIHLDIEIEAGKNWMEMSAV